MWKETNGVPILTYIHVYTVQEPATKEHVIVSSNGYQEDARVGWGLGWEGRGVGRVTSHGKRNKI